VERGDEKGREGKIPIKQERKAFLCAGGMGKVGTKDCITGEEKKN